MAEKYANNYLNSFVNRSENISELINMYLTTTSSRAGAMFVRKGESNKYSCVDHVSLDHIDNDIIDCNKVKVQY